MKLPWLLGSLLVLMSTSTFAQDAAGDPGQQWRELQPEYDRAFTMVPIRRLFGNPDKELKLSRRAPYTAAAKAELAARRTKDRLSRSQALAERNLRDDIVKRVAALGDDRAAKLLMRTWQDQLENIELAQRNFDRFVDANSVNINPGVDPGGVYWQRWMGKHELPAARGVLTAEQRVKDLALAGCVKLMTPDVKDWLAKHAESHEQIWVREEMVAALAKSSDVGNVTSLGRILDAEPEVWARVMIVLALGEAKAPGSDVFVLRALADEAWPVRSAAISSVRMLGLRDTGAIDALVARLEADDGKLRLEARNALAVATGKGFGLEPEEWRDWWENARPEWKERAAPTKIEEYTEGLPRFCGSATASKRVVFLVSRGAHMAEPTKRRSNGNAGQTSSAPTVDTTLRIAAWELEQTLQRLPEDALFTVILYGAEPKLWSKKLKAPTRDSRAKAVRFVRKAAPEGRSVLATAMDATLRIGVAKRVDDLALAGVGDVDTIFVVGGTLNAVGSLGGPLSGKAVVPRVRRLRRVDIRVVRPGVK